MQTAPAPVLLHRRVPAALRVRTILAPIDFSSSAREAVAWALLFASLTGARVRLLHALAGPGGRTSAIRRAAIDAVEMERGRAERQLRRFGNPVVRVEAEVVQTTDAARSILETARKGVDAVVLGGSGKSGLTAVLGSVSRGVAKECPLPVLVVPAANRASARDVWERARTHGGSRARLSA
jgi:nucleotide-binding universal stress UspA family protein